MSKIVEEWRPVVGYEGLYEVSDWGNVRSVDRTFEYYNRGNLIKRTFKGQPLKKVLNFEGYHIVTLSDANHKQRQCKVHRLVAAAWLPNPENKDEVGHLKTLDNGLEDKTANEAWNLAWMTREENANYGTIGERLSQHMIGDKNPMKRPEVAAMVAEKQKINGKMRFMKDPEGFFAKMAANREKAYEKIKIKVIQINNNTGEILKIWNSAADVERALGICHQNITACCKGRKKSAGGFKWKYYEN